MKSWDSLLIESLQPRADKVPTRFKTAQQWAKHFNKSRRSVEELFAKLQPEKKTFKIIVGKQLREVTHWAVHNLETKQTKSS